MMRIFPVVLVLCACSLAAIGYEMSASKPVASMDGYSFIGPVNPTPAEVSLFTVAVAAGKSPPPGWTVTGMEGKVSVVDTGSIVSATRERVWSVTLMDDTADLDTATVYLNSEPRFTATRANGAILDRSGMSVATLPLILPEAGTASTARVEWRDADNVVRAWECSVP